MEGVRALDPSGGVAHMVELVLREKADREHELVVLVHGFRSGVIDIRGVCTPAFEDVTDIELGALCTAEQTTFRVFSPDSQAVYIVLYREATGDSGRDSRRMEHTGNGIWELTIPGDLHGKHYMVYVDTDGPLTRREVVDIYTRCATGHDGRGKIVDPRRLDPENFRPIQRPENIARPTDAVIYEAHVRDFTISQNSGVSTEHRGKYLGMVQHRTRLPGSNIQTGIDHLVELGVTHVQLLPVQDFENDEVKGPYNWGYMTVNFWSPEGWYASDPRTDSRIGELKELVKRFHDAGIRVVMDVVYNHTGHTSCFESIAPNYFHRMREDGSLWNGSGTGNEFRSESPMGRQFIVECCKYWVEEYGIDGFRFDLMGLIDKETMERVREELLSVDPTLLVYGEPWAAVGPEDTGLGKVLYKDNVAGTGIGCFNDNFRNALKGSPDGDEPGYVQNASHRDGVKKGIQGAIHDWAAQPGEAIQYADCHDNLCLWDKLELSTGIEDEAVLARMQRLAIGILAVSQGCMFLHGGSEFGRTKGGNHNSYNAPDSVNAFNWNLKKQHHDIFVYTQGMIAIRRGHPIFRLASREEIDRRLKFRDDLCPDSTCIAFTLDGSALEGESWQTVAVLINPTEHDLEFKLPEGNWLIYVQGASASIDPILPVCDSIPVAARTLAVIARQTAKERAAPV